MSSSNTPNNELDDIFNTVFTEKKPPATPSSAQLGQPQTWPATPTNAGATTTCGVCGAQNDAARKFCGMCGAALQPTPPQPTTVYCGKCGAQNNPAQKFCGSCGAPLQGNRPRPVVPMNSVPISGQSASGMLARTTTGYKVASPGAVIAILCFFLPWVFVSCGGSTGYTFTGMELTFGKQVEQFAGAVSRTDSAPLLMLALLAAVAVIGLAVMAFKRGKLTQLDGVGVIALGAGALLLLVIQGLISQNDLQSRSGYSPEITLQIGFFGVVIGYLAVIAGGILNQLRKP